MSDDHFIVNSLPSLAAFNKLCNDMLSEHRYLTFTWRIGPDRSLPQNALFHVWLTEYAGYLLKKRKEDVTEGELDGMKRTVKREYYLETGLSHLVYRLVNPRNPAENRMEYTSSANWKQGEMKAALDWIAMKASQDGLVLEAKGEYAKLLREEQAA